MLPSQSLAPGRAREGAGKDRVHQRAQPGGIRSGDEVDRRAHQRRTHHSTVAGEAGKLHGIEVAQAAPQREVRDIGHLRLQTNKVFHDLEDRRG